MSLCAESSVGPASGSLSKSARKVGVDQNFFDSLIQTRYQTLHDSPTALRKLTQEFDHPRMGARFFLARGVAKFVEKYQLPGDGVNFLRLYENAAHVVGEQFNGV